MIFFLLSTIYALLAGWCFARREWFSGTCLAITAVIYAAGRLWRYYKERLVPRGGNDDPTVSPK